MAALHKDSQANALASATTIPITFTGVNPGDLIVLTLRAVSTASVSDGSSNVYHQIGSTQGNHTCWYTVHAGGTNTTLVVTGSTSGAAGDIRIVGDWFSSVVPWSGLPLATQSYANPLTGTLYDPGPTANVGAGELIWTSGDANASLAPYTAGSSQGAVGTLGNNTVIVSRPLVTCYILSGNSGTQDLTITTTGSIVNGTSDPDVFQAVFDVPLVSSPYAYDLETDIDRITMEDGLGVYITETAVPLFTEYLLEDGTGDLVLEDGSGAYLAENLLFYAFQQESIEYRYLLEDGLGVFLSEEFDTQPIFYGYQFEPTTDRFLLEDATGILISEEPQSLGGTVFQQILTVTSATSATIVKQIGKLLSVVSATPATLLKGTTKIVQATSASAATIVKQVGKVVTAASATSATLLRTTTKIVLAVSASATTIVVNKTKLQIVQVTTTTSATLIRQTTKIVKGTSASSATLSRLIGKLVLGSSMTVATFQRLIIKIVQVGSATVSSLLASKTKLQLLQTASATSATIIRQISKLLKVTTVTSSTVVRSITKIVQVTSASAAAIVKQAGKVVTLSNAVSVTILRTITKFLQIASATNVSLVRQIGKLLVAASASNTQIIRKEVAVRALTETLTLADSTRKAVGKFITEALTIADTAVRNAGGATFIAISETLSLAESVVRGLVAGRTSTETLSLTETVKKAVDKVVGDALGSDALVYGTGQYGTATYGGGIVDLVIRLRNIPVAIIETLNISDVIARLGVWFRIVIEFLGPDLYGNPLYGGVLYGSIKDTDVKSAGKPITETLSLTDAVQRLYLGVRALIENLALTEFTVKAVSKALADTLSISDATRLNSGRPIAESLAISDATAFLYHGFRVALETLSLSDLVSRFHPQNVFTADTLAALSDAVTKRGNFFRPAAEWLGGILYGNPLYGNVIYGSIQDFVTQGSGKRVTETLAAITDNVVRRFVGIRVPVETLNLTDVVARLAVLRRFITETLPNIIEVVFGEKLLPGKAKTFIAPKRALTLMAPVRVIVYTAPFRAPFILAINGRYGVAHYGTDFYHNQPGVFVVPVRGLTKSAPNRKLTFTVVPE